MIQESYKSSVFFSMIPLMGYHPVSRSAMWAVQGQPKVTSTHKDQEMDQTIFHPESYNVYLPTDTIHIYKSSDCTPAKTKLCSVFEKRRSESFLP